VDVLTTWAAVEPRKTNPLLAALAGQTMPRMRFEVTLRYPPSISIVAGMRIADGGRYYLIQNVSDMEERHRELRLECEDVPAPGA
jgi:SPP1 family predicted phage head-tail adaptor